LEKPSARDPYAFEPQEPNDFDNVVNEEIRVEWLAPGTWPVKAPQISTNFSVNNDNKSD